jgi:hypothetical protein
MERFVQAITGGGLALVAGLWLLTLPSSGPAWGTGIGLALLGLGGLAYGLWNALCPD